MWTSRWAILGPKKAILGSKRTILGSKKDALGPKPRPRHAKGTRQGPGKLAGPQAQAQTGPWRTLREAD